MSDTPTLCVVIPTWNAAKTLPRILRQLAAADRVVVADGGSTDASVAAAIAGGAVIAMGAKGRGQQLSLGAQHTAGADWLLFLHADNRLPECWHQSVVRHITRHPTSAGYFGYQADAKGFWPRFMDVWIGMRCQWWGLPYGDQGLLISREMYDALGGYKDMALFEDVDIIDRFKAKFGRTKLRGMRGRIIMNVEKYDGYGIWKTGWRNLELMKDYHRGVPVAELAERYRT